MGMFDSIRDNVQKTARKAITGTADVLKGGVAAEKLRQGKELLSEKTSFLSGKAAELSGKAAELARKLPGKDDVSGAIGKLRKTAEQAIRRK